MGRSRFLSSRVPGTVGSTKSMNFMTDLTPLLGGVIDEGKTSSSAGLSDAPALATDRRDRSTSAMACQHDRVRLLRAHHFHKSRRAALSGALMWRGAPAPHSGGGGIAQQPLSFAPAPPHPPLDAV